MWAETIWGHLGTFTFHTEEMVEVKNVPHLKRPANHEKRGSTFYIYARVHFGIFFYILLIIVLKEIKVETVSK